MSSNVGYVFGVDWQEVTVLGITALTAGLFVWSKFRPRKFSFERDTHCGCASSAESAPKTSIVYRAKRGERPQIVMRMK